MSARRKNIRITPAKLRAQQANARLSRGPRTREGRRRSALNRRSLEFSFILHGLGRKSDARELQRIWRDLLAQFWFIKPKLWQRERRLEPTLQRLAWAWWRKLISVRTGASKEELAKLDGWIESDLAEFLFEFRVGNRKADHWLRKEFGTDGCPDMAGLRERIEARLRAFRKQKRGAASVRQGTPGEHDRRSAPATSAMTTEQGALDEPVKGRVNRV